MQKKRILASGLVAGLLCAWVTGQPSKLFGPWQDTPEFLAAGEKLNTDIPAGRQQFVNIADQNPGTALGAMSLFSAAAWSTGEEDSTSPSAQTNSTNPQPSVPQDPDDARIAQMRATYQRVINEYPNSHYEMMARECLLEMDVPQTGFEPYVQALEAILIAHGAPTTSEVTRDRLSAVQRIQALPNEDRAGAFHLYERLRYGYSSLKRTNEAWTLDLLGHTLGLSGIDIKGSLALQNGKVWRSLPRQDPEVRVVQPKARTGSRPWVKLEITCGNYLRPQVDVGKIKIGLDGQDISKRVGIRFKFDKKLRENKTFETLRIRYRPTVDLAPGPHVLTVYAPTGGYNPPGPGATSVTYNFSVRQNDRQDEQEDSDDPECE